MLGMNLRVFETFPNPGR